MFFAAPIWLLALVPWAALAVWMLWGRRERVGVPFLALWRDGEARPRTSRAAQLPPITIVLLLVAILLAILAASSLALSASGVPQITVLIDRGITMSARQGDAYRYQRAAELLAPHLSGHVRLVVVPHREVASADARGFLAAVRSIPPTAADTSGDVAQAVARLLATTDEPIVALSDQPIDITDRRVVPVAPSPLTSNAGLAQISAVDSPSPQVMVRVGSAPQAKLGVVVSSDGQRVEQAVEDTAFIDVPRLGKTVEVDLAAGDALSADDRAWLVRESGWPRIEPSGTLPPELMRMVEAYRKLRPAREDARVISVTNSEPAAGEAVILAPATIAASGAPSVVAHAITSNVAWAEVLKDARVGAALPAGFSPLVSVNGGVALAVQEQPVRQVWIALDAPSFARRADYVVFWTNVIDWIGQSGDAFAAHPIALLGDDWRRVTDGPDATEPGLWPGVYKRSDGTLRAVNAPFVKPSSPNPVVDWQRRLANASTGGANGGPLSSYLLLAALCCAPVAAWRWPVRRAARTAAST